MTTWFETDLPQGYIVAGKWRKKRYRLERKLGEGANGKVYLVSQGNKWYALKMGANTVDLQSEINIVRKLSASCSEFKGYYIDSDDAEYKGTMCSFYVMKYVRGESPLHYVQQHGREWIGVLGINILRKLVGLHQQGYIFGDLKMENLIATSYGNVELIDFGGVTELGSGVRQFTELYDRGCWNAGSRKADEGYDLFSYAILCIQLAATRSTMLSRHMLPQNRSLELLEEELDKDTGLHRYKSFIEYALKGRYPASREALDAWRAIPLAPGKSEAKSWLPYAERWIGIGFAVSVVLFGTAVYWLWS